MESSPLAFKREQALSEAESNRRLEAVVKVELDLNDVFEGTNLAGLYRDLASRSSSNPALLSLLHLVNTSADMFGAMVEVDRGQSGWKVHSSISLIIYAKSSSRKSPMFDTWTRHATRRRL